MVLTVGRDAEVPIARIAVKMTFMMATADSFSNWFRFARLPAEGRRVEVWILLACACIAIGSGIQVAAQGAALERAIHKVRSAAETEAVVRVDIAPLTGIALLRSACSGIVITRPATGIVALYWIGSDSPPVLPSDFLIVSGLQLLTLTLCFLTLLLMKIRIWIVSAARLVCASVSVLVSIGLAMSLLLDAIR